MRRPSRLKKVLFCSGKVKSTALLLLNKLVGPVLDADILLAVIRINRGRLDPFKFRLLTGFIIANAFELRTRLRGAKRARSLANRRFRHTRRAEDRN